jgi:phosphoribosylformylglycinamidine cyclo-ligase
MVTYRDAGVDIDAAEELVDRIKPIVRSTHNECVLSDIGAFGGFFRPDWGAFSDPVLVSSVDGVGTKLLVARDAGVFHTVGQDLVNHCVNDIAVCGAVPLFFLDYFSTGVLTVDVGEKVIAGFATACRENGCALIGGEIAEMPDVYAKGDFDLAGTVVGVVERSRIVGGESAEAGDVLIGLPSTGLHTNGYSLARRVLLSSLKLDDTPEELDGSTVGQSMLAVHRSYLTAIRTLLDGDLVHGLAHVTGGGIVGNTSRVVPNGLRLDVDWGSWEVPGVFRLIQRLGDVPEDDMRRTFNLGVGLVAVAAASAVDRAVAALADLGEECMIVGSVVSDDPN